MTTTRCLLIAALGGACGQVRQDRAPEVDAPATSDPDGDAPEPDAAPQGRCDPGKPFGAATPVANINSAESESGFGITADDLTGFVTSPSGSFRILTTQRTSVDDAFGAPTNGLTSALNAVAGDELGGSPSSDGVVLYFHRQSGAAIGVFAATRASTAAPFGAGSAVRVDGVALTNAFQPKISADGNTLYWLDLRDLTVQRAERTGGPTSFGSARRITTFTLASPPVVSADELTMYYSPGTIADDVHVTTRASVAEPFGVGVPIPNVSSTSNDTPVALSVDGCVLYIASKRAGTSDIWEARRPR